MATPSLYAFAHKFDLYAIAYGDQVTTTNRPLVPASRFARSIGRRPIQMLQNLGLKCILSEVL